MAASTSILVEDPNDPGTYLVSGFDPNDPDLVDFYPEFQEFPTKLEWNRDGQRLYEIGLDRGVLYVDDKPGVVWNGLVSVKEAPRGGESSSYYYEGVQYASPISLEEWAANLEAFTYPDEFAKCEGAEMIANGMFITQQRRRSFGISYRTLIGNDTAGSRRGYKIHIIYNAQAAPSDRDYETLGTDDEPMTFNWNLSARPRKFKDPSFGIRYAAHIVIDSTKIYPWALRALEELLYGTDFVDPKLPSPSELLALFEANALLPVTDNGDGTWTASGPDSVVNMIDEDTFQINWPSAVFVTDDTYTINSL